MSVLLDTQVIYNLSTIFDNVMENILAHEVFFCTSYYCLWIGPDVELDDFRVSMQGSLGSTFTLYQQCLLFFRNTWFCVVTSQCLC
jgi:hypothetical protein